MHNKTLYFLFFPLIAFSACNTPSSPNAPSTSSSEGNVVVADTILYPVDVINLDTTNTWATRRIRNLNHKKMTDLLFEAVYSGKATAMDYYNDDTIPAEKLREMEASGKFNRNQLAQLQFEETWQIAPNEGTMTKKVNSVLLAWPVFDSKGNFQAYQAGFVIEFKP